VKCDASCQIK